MAYLLVGRVSDDRALVQLPFDNQPGAGQPSLEGNADRTSLPLHVTAVDLQVEASHLAVVLECDHCEEFIRRRHLSRFLDADDTNDLRPVQLQIHPYLRLPAGWFPLARRIYHQD